VLQSVQAMTTAVTEQEPRKKVLGGEKLDGFLETIEKVLASPSPHPFLEALCSGGYHA
jgi:hypothetical protein